MMKLIALIAEYFFLLLKLTRFSGMRTLAAENIVLRQQLIALSRCHKRAPKLTFFDRVSLGLFTSLVNVERLSRIAIAIKPATLLKFHKALIRRKYHLLFSNKSSKKPGPKGPEQAIIDLIVEMKRRNPSYGYRRIAMQVSNSFDVSIDKDIVRRVLSQHYKNNPHDTGPSWLTFIGHIKGSLWSIDLFCCESIHLKTHWVLVVLDQYTRRIIGFSTHKGLVAGLDLCCMFNAVMTQKRLPKYLISDNDPLFGFHQWQANLRILEIESIKSVPYVPQSHPFIERCIGTVRREFLDRILFLNARDLHNKLTSFQTYYNTQRCHHGINQLAPLQKAEEQSANVISINHYRWSKQCHGLFQLPRAA